MLEKRRRRKSHSLPILLFVMASTVYEYIRKCYSIISLLLMTGWVWTKEISLHIATWQIATLASQSSEGMNYPFVEASTVLGKCGLTAGKKPLSNDQTELSTWPGVNNCGGLTVCVTRSVCIYTQICVRVRKRATFMCLNVPHMRLQVGRAGGTDWPFVVWQGDHVINAQ